MVHWPAWMLLNTTAKWWAFVTNRTLTWTGFYAARKRLRASKLWWAWLVAINVCSLAVLALLFLWWHHYAHSR